MTTSARTSSSWQPVSPAARATPRVGPARGRVRWGSDEGFCRYRVILAPWTARDRGVHMGLGFPRGNATPEPVDKLQISGALMAPSDGPSPVSWPMPVTPRTAWASSVTSTCARSARTRRSACGQAPCGSGAACCSSPSPTTSGPMGPTARVPHRSGPSTSTATSPVAACTGGRARVWPNSSAGVSSTPACPDSAEAIRSTGTTCRWRCWPTRSWRSCTRSKPAPSSSSATPWVGRSPSNSPMTTPGTPSGLSIATASAHRPGNSGTASSPRWSPPSRRASPPWSTWARRR